MEEKKVLLKAENIKKYFPITGLFGKVENYVKAVDGVSLELYQGETYGLVGETGCGKSTLGRTLIQLLQPSEGTITLDGEDISRLTTAESRKLRRRVQMVFQDPYTSLNPRKRIGDILTEALDIQNIGSSDERMDIAMELMQQVGLLVEHYYRYPHELSGGQRQRVGLARALIVNPELVVCDEPVSALDVSVQSQILNLLVDMQKKRKLTYLFISHDMAVIRYVSDRVGVMYLGHLVEEADTAELFRNPRHPYTQVLLSAVPSPNPHVRKQRTVLEGDLPSPIDPPAGCVFHTRCPYATERCRRETPEMRSVGEGHKLACHREEA